MIGLLLKSLGLKSIIKFVVGFINDYEDLILEKIPDENTKEIIDDFTDLIEKLLRKL